jgi:hypothetical protein
MLAKNALIFVKIVRSLPVFLASSFHENAMWTSTKAGK